MKSVALFGKETAPGDTHQGNNVVCEPAVVLIFLEGSLSLMWKFRAEYPFPADRWILPSKRPGCFLEAVQVW